MRQRPTTIHAKNGLAADFYRQLQKAEREIIQWPELWKQVGGCYRRRNLDRFPYAMIYHPLPDDVLEVNPHFPALRPGPMALSGAS
ncbi:MAG: hypothetical protein WCG52_11670, partial [bacterium]